jgi:hypothetical protein
MAVAEQALKTDDASRKTGSTTTKRKRERTARRRDGGKAAGKDGVERLRQAADRRVGRNSEELADLLTKKALDGHLASTKVLVGLAGAKKPIAEPVKKRSGLTAAELLMADIKQHGQWKWEEEEGSAETGVGGVEAEG